MTANITSDTWIRIVAELSECLKAPSEAIPNVRWMSGTRLRKLLVDIRNKANAPKHESGTKLLSLLIDSKLVWPLPPDDFSDCGKPCAIYALKFSGTPSISPIELLQATQPSYHHTVICYFTALAHHELTTQDAPHHHVAVLRTPPKKARPESATPPPASAENAVGEPKLGSLLFHYQTIPYYMTQRDPALLPGIQTVRLSPSCMIRMTTLEQTLLDTLHKPWRCGGPSVVFEAWERGVPLLDENRLAHYLTLIGRTDFIRRAGYMLEQSDHATSDSALRALLADAKDKVKTGHVPTIPLLPDVPATRHNPTWGLDT